MLQNEFDPLLESLYEDHDLIVTLFFDGMPPATLAEKFDVPVQVMQEFLNHLNIEHMSLKDLENQWSEITKPVIITVSKKPRFILTPYR